MVISWGKHKQRVYWKMSDLDDFAVCRSQLICKMEDDMVQKQTYLRQQILEKQYDPQKFIEFLNNRLSIGDDLSLCSLSQLKQVVQEFLAAEHSSLHLDPQDPVQSIINSQSLIRNDSLTSTLKPRTILFEKFNFTEPEFTKTFQCIKINDRLSKGKEIHCEVGNPQRKNTGGFFGIGATSFLEFEVKTVEMGWAVGRRYSDFIWLRDFLRKVYPTQVVPPIPEKKAAKRTQRHVEKRMRILEYFLNDVANIPEFLNNRYVEGFLRITDPAKLSQLKDQSEKVKPSGSTSQIETSTGEVTVRFSAETRAYSQEMKRLIPEMERLYKQVTRQGKALQNIQTEEVNTLYEMGNLFAELHEKSREVLNRIPGASGLSKLNSLYIALNNMTIQWGNILRGQFQIIEKNVNTFFKYVRNDLHGYFELFTAQEAAEEEFAKARLTLDRKKEKIYSVFDPAKWELSKDILSTLPKEIVHDKAQAFKVMLPRENAQLDRLRVRNCLLISQLYVNGDSNFSRSAAKFEENFKEWSIKVKVNTQQISELWSEMASSFSGGSKVQQLKEKPQEQRSDQIYDD